MCIRFTDEEGHVGHIGEDLSLLDYSGPEAWRERIEERLEGMESVLTEVSVDTRGMDPDQNGEPPPHEWVTLEGEERMACLAELLSRGKLIRSAGIPEK